MRVVRLTAENFMGLKAVEIEPGSGTVIISGRNGQGKSSILNAIWAALGGGQASRQIPAPVRRGEHTAEVTVDLGELRVTRSWKDDGHTSYLRVTAADGSRLSSPQAVLDRLVGQLTFDPLAFSRLSPREQVAALVAVVDLPFDPAAVDAQRQALYDRRTEVSRDARRLEGELENKPGVPDGLPERELSVADLAAQQAAALRAQQAHAALVRRTEDADRDHQRAVADIARLERELEAARARAVDAAARATAGRREVQESLEALPDLDAIAQQLATVEETNRWVRLRDERFALAELAAEQRAAAAALTQQIEDIDAQRAKALESADMPLPGLAFDHEGVTLHGVPLKACSGAEQLRASVAIAMAASPRLRILRVTDGALLDEDGIALIESMAREQDYQLWLEVVSSTGDVGIVIEDGAVAAVN